jgi:hypothetical protein
MSKDPDTGTKLDQPATYEIRLGAQLSPQWVDWFDGLAITLEESGQTTLVGPVADQAALFGLLKKVRDLGIPLLSVNLIPPLPKKE